MADIKNFVFLKDWYDSLSKVQDEAKRNDFTWRLVKYGITGEMDFTDDDFANGWLKQICGAIDSSKEKYAKKIEQGKTVGRKKSYSEDDLKRYIAEGRKAKEIAGLLGVGVSAIYHDEVWVKRKENGNYNL